MTESEELVFKLSKRSFLSLWSFANPLNESGKELCDILVVCDPDILIISVKEIVYKDSGRPTVDFERWRRAAIEESCKQIYGAQRSIEKATNVINATKEVAYRYPPLHKRRIHRIAVALGSKEKVPLTFGDFGKGFVHVFDEKSLDAIMTELDTVSDFVAYLVEKESLLNSGRISYFAGEEDLLAVYLVSGNTFPTDPDDFFLDEGLWSAIHGSAEMKERKSELEVSYVWDNVIERAFENFSNDNYRTAWADEKKTHEELEFATRAMARENRLMRKFLGERILGLFERGVRTQARIVDMAESPVIYMLMAADYDGDRELNHKELQARCLVARGLDHSKNVVIGILMERTNRHEGEAISFCFIDVQEWNDEWQSRMDLYRNELGFFKNISPAKLKGTEMDPQT